MPRSFMNADYETSNMTSLLDVEEPQCFPDKARMVLSDKFRRGFQINLAGQKIDNADARVMGCNTRAKCRHFH